MSNGNRVTLRNNKIVISTRGRGPQGRAGIDGTVRDYDSNDSYQKGQFVYNGADLYLALQDAPAGVLLNDVSYFKHINTSDDDTTYSFSQVNDHLVINSSDGSTQTVTDVFKDTTYSIGTAGNDLVFYRDGVIDSIIPDVLVDQTVSYVFQQVGDDLVITDSSGNVQTLSNAFTNNGLVPIVTGKLKHPE